MPLALWGALVFSGGCAGEGLPFPAREFLVPAEVSLRIEKVLYEYDPPSGNLMGDGTRVFIGLVEESSLEKFLRKHASQETEWSSGPWHIGEVGISGDDLVAWFKGWFDTSGISKDIARVIDWESLLKAGGSGRYYRTWYKHHETSGGKGWQVDTARLWIVDPRSRMVVFFLVNT